jgi:hypothetical protein
MYDVDVSVFELQLHVTRQLMVDHWSLPERTLPHPPQADSYAIIGLSLSLSLSLYVFTSERVFFTELRYEHPFDRHNICNRF